MQPADKPLIIQSDGSILLEVHSASYEVARDTIAPFAELVKSPEYVHTYRITPLSLWNASAMGMSLREVMDGLARYSRYEMPQAVERRIVEAFDRWDAVRLYGNDVDTLLVEARDEDILSLVISSADVSGMVVEVRRPRTLVIPRGVRGRFKHACIKMGYPVHDLVGYEAGDPLSILLREVEGPSGGFRLRAYQVEAADHFWAGGSPKGGQGIVVLPCGAGKTVVGMAVMARASTHTLVLCTNVSAVNQWVSELLDKTTLTAGDIGVYIGGRKEMAPVTVTTYQMLTYRRSRQGPFEHMNLMKARNWGLIIYDEVHVMPAPVFRATTELQAKRRLGLTATLIREDGLEEDTFSLVGPKCYDIPWKELEQKGFIAQALCCEVRVPLPPLKVHEYVNASDRAQFRIASENTNKEDVLKEILKRHCDEPVLVIGQYLSQLRRISARINAPIITGSTANQRRDELYESFRRGNIPVLVVSKVANFAIDLPDASVAVQVSGTFGSRQEEAQRLGRILRPKDRVSTFYTLVSKDTSEEVFSHRRQVFLAEQGYRYRIEEWSVEDLDA
jgi:DNA excision repair protein ERCC-3